MTRRRKIIACRAVVRRRRVAALLLAVLGIFACFVFRGPREPVYGGKPLSYWVNIVNQPPSLKYSGNVAPHPEYDQAAVALRHIGTNAMLFFIPMLSARDSGAKIELMSLTDRVPFLRGWPEPASARQLRALTASLVIGPDAETAVPALVELARELRAGQKRAETVYLFTLQALNKIASKAARADLQRTDPAVAADLPTTNYIFFAK